MRDPNYYLGEGRFTKRGKPVQDKARDIGKNPEKIDEYIRSLYEKRDNIPLDDYKEALHGREAERIIQDGFIAMQSDSGLVFVTLCREVGIPASYILTIDPHDSLNLISKRVFADIYDGRKWNPRYPGYGEAKKEDNRYILRFEFPILISKSFMEVARGLDSSELWDITGKKIELYTREDLDNLLKREEYQSLLKKHSSPILSPPPA